MGLFGVLLGGGSGSGGGGWWLPVSVAVRLPFAVCRGATTPLLPPCSYAYKVYLSTLLPCTQMRSKEGRGNPSAYFYLTKQNVVIATLSAN